MISAEENTISTCPFRLDAAEHRVTRGEASVQLMPKTFEVFKYLYDRMDMLISKEELYRALWTDSKKRPKPNSINVFICQLRTDLQGLGQHSDQHIVTIRRGGYIFSSTPRKGSICSSRMTPAEASKWAEKITEYGRMYDTLDDIYREAA